MKVRYIGLYADDGVELHDGTWFDGNVDTDVADLGEDRVRGLLGQPTNFVPADAEAEALLADLEPESPLADDPPADDASGEDASTESTPGDEIPAEEQLAATDPEVAS